MSNDSIAEKYNIGVSTASEIYKRRKEIESAVENSQNTGISLKRKTLREASKPLVEQELYSWYLEQDFNVSQMELIEKAKEINYMLNQESEEDLEPWNPTKGWLIRFKERYGIKSATSNKNEEQKSHTSALEAAEYLLDYINKRDYLLKDVITVRMIRDRIAIEQNVQIDE